LLCAAVSCGLFFLFPFENKILSIFANISLGLSVFCGAYYAGSRTPFFQIKKTLFLPCAILLLLFCGTILFGSFDKQVFLQKSALVFVASILGEISGRR
jgi:hypothetical protein